MVANVKDYSEGEKQDIVSQLLIFGPDVAHVCNGAEEATVAPETAQFSETDWVKRGE